MEASFEPFENLISSLNIIEDSNPITEKTKLQCLGKLNTKLSKGKTINAFENLKNKFFNDTIFKFESSIGSTQSKINKRFSKKLSRSNLMTGNRGKHRLRRVKTHNANVDL